MPTFVPVADPGDPLIEAYRDIRERDLVGREGRFVAEGAVVLRVLLTRSRHRVLSLLLADTRIAALAADLAMLPEETPVYVAPQEVLDGIAGFHLHRGILAIGKRGHSPPPREALAALPAKALVLALHAIANHDNMGGLFRNAAAFGVDLVLLDSDCCDPLYRKAIRVSAGNVLSVPLARLAPGEDAVALLSAEGFVSVALSPSGATPLAGAPRPDRLALHLGAEGPGLPESILRRTLAVRIAMAPGIDSLNVATASGIALHHFAKRD